MRRQFFEVEVRAGDLREPRGVPCSLKLYLMTPCKKHTLVVRSRSGADRS